jgi:hypothetical protein
VRASVAIRILLVASLLAVIVLVIVGWVASGAAATVTGLLVLATLIWVVPNSDFRELLENLRSLNVGPQGVSAEFYQRVKAVAAVRAPEQQEEKETPASTSVSKLRLLMEAKLAYIAKDLLEERPTFVTVGSLNHDRFLDDETAAVADDILTLRDEDLLNVPREERERILSAADEVVRTIRARVLHGWVKKTLDDARGWTWEPVDRGPSRLPDFLASHGEKDVLVASVFATSKDSDVFGRAKERLQRKDGVPSEVNRRVMVVPRKARDSLIRSEGEPVVVRAQDLRGLLDQIKGPR